MNSINNQFLQTILENARTVPENAPKHFNIKLYKRCINELTKSTSFPEPEIEFPIHFKIVRMKHSRHNIYTIFEDIPLEKPCKDLELIFEVCFSYTLKGLIAYDLGIIYIDPKLDGVYYIYDKNKNPMTPKTWKQIKKSIVEELSGGKE